MLEVIADGVLDALKSLPFLFGAYWLMEFLEHWRGGGQPLLQRLGPLGGALPRSLEAWMVDLVDTICAGLEVSRICRPSRLRERLGVRPLISAC